MPTVLTCFNAWRGLCGFVFFCTKQTWTIINDFSIDFNRETFFQFASLAKRCNLHTTPGRRNLNAVKGLNFPIRQLDITIKHFPRNVENYGGKWWKFLLPLCFSAQHTTWMSRSCMFDYVLTIISAFSFRGMKNFWKFSKLDCKHNARIKHTAKWTSWVDEEIIVQFSDANSTLIASWRFHFKIKFRVEIAWVFTLFRTAEIHFKIFTFKLLLFLFSGSSKQQIFIVFH